MYSEGVTNNTFIIGFRSTGYGALRNGGHSHSRPHQQSETLGKVVTAHIFRIVLPIEP